MRYLFHGPGPTYFRVSPAIPKATGVPPSAHTALVDIEAGQKITGNRGNLIHAEAPAKLFRKNNLYSAFSNLAHLHATLGADYADFLKAKFDVIVISQANYIRPKQNHQTLADAVRDIPPEVKLVVLGAGLQDTLPQSKLTESTIELSKLFDDRCALFGVRGEITKGWLEEELGATNVTVLGCPSLYVYPLSIRDLSYDNIPRHDPRIVSAGHLSKSKLTVEQTKRGRTFASAFEGVRADYVFQDEPFGYEPYLQTPGFYNEGTGEMRADLINRYLSDISGFKINFGAYYYFIESGAWRQMYRRYDAYVGDRFHAGVACIQSSTPALILKHDSRVEELTNYFQIPTISLKEFTEVGLSEAIRSRLTPEALQRFKATYETRLSSFCDTMAGLSLDVVSRELLSAPVTHEPA